MKVENQVCTAEQAKNLRDLGISAPAIFVWCKSAKGFALFPVDAGLHIYSATEWYYAYTLAELNEMLGVYAGFYLRVDGEWRFPCSHNFLYQAQAGANRLIELIEFDSVTIQSCNKRLLESDEKNQH